MNSAQTAKRRLLVILPQDRADGQWVQKGVFRFRASNSWPRTLHPAFAHPRPQVTIKAVYRWRYHA